MLDPLGSQRGLCHRVNEIRRERASKVEQFSQKCVLMQFTRTLLTDMSWFHSSAQSDSFFVHENGIQKKRE